MEGDGKDPGAVGYVKISTHALTWRATAKADKIIKELWDFYPRPHMEGDGAAIV